MAIRRISCASDQSAADLWLVCTIPLLRRFALGTCKLHYVFSNMLLLDKLLEKLLHRYISHFILLLGLKICTVHFLVIFSFFYFLFFISFLQILTINSKLWSIFHVKWKRNKDICLLSTLFNNYKRKYITSLNTVTGIQTNNTRKRQMPRCIRWTNKASRDIACDYQWLLTWLMRVVVAGIEETSDVLFSQFPVVNFVAY